MRARINVLSELHDDWASHVERWRELNHALSRASRWSTRANRPTMNTCCTKRSSAHGRFEGLPTADSRQSFTERIKSVHDQGAGAKRRC